MLNKLPPEFKDSAQKCNLDQTFFQKNDLAHLWIESHRVLSTQKTAGLELVTRSSSREIKISLIVKKGVILKKPIFLCFGILGEKGHQLIVPEIILEEKAEATIFGFCTFPDAQNIIHQMKAEIRLGPGAKLNYRENHYHGENFGTRVETNFNLSLAEKAILNNELILEKGSVGKFKIGLEANLAKDSFVNILTKIIGQGAKDRVNIYDKINLQGENSRALVKMRGAAINGGHLIFKGNMRAEAKNACGHLDCQEIVVGHSIARSTPIIQSNHPEARITHEASVGKVNQKELETLLTRGLSEKEAIDFIIRGSIQ